jgi:Coenzyme PQQ synthesis protein D (PqqD)
LKIAATRFNGEAMTESENAIMDRVPVPITDVKTEVIEGELLLYDPRQTKALYLNSSAAVIWTLCDGHRTTKEIIQLIGDGYPEAKTNLTEEVLTTLEQLYESGVLVSLDGYEGSR